MLSLSKERILVYPGSSNKSLLWKIETINDSLMILRTRSRKIGTESAWDRITFKKVLQQ